MQDVQVVGLASKAGATHATFQHLRSWEKSGVPNKLNLQPWCIQNYCAASIIGGFYAYISRSPSLSLSLSVYRTCIDSYVWKDWCFRNLKFSTHRLKSQNHLFPRIFSLERSLGNGRFPCIMHKCPNKCITTWPEIHAERVEMDLFQFGSEKMQHIGIQQRCGIMRPLIFEAFWSCTKSVVFEAHDPNLHVGLPGWRKNVVTLPLRKQVEVVRVVPV